MWLCMTIMMMMMATGLRMLLLNKISALFSFKATSRKLSSDAHNFRRERERGSVRVFMGI